MIVDIRLFRFSDMRNHERVLSDRALEGPGVVYVNVKGLFSSIHNEQENADVLERCFDARFFLISSQCRILLVQE